MAVNFDAVCGLVGAHTNTVDQSDVLARISYPVRNKFTDGSAATNCDIFFEDKQTAVSGAVNYDLDGLTDRWGNSISFATVRMLFIANLGTAESTGITVGGDWFTTNVQNGGGGASLDGGDVYFRTWYRTAIAVTATTADVLTITPDTTASWVLFIGGID